MESVAAEEQAAEVDAAGKSLGVLQGGQHGYGATLRETAHRDLVGGNSLSDEFVNDPMDALHRDLRVLERAAQLGRIVARCKRQLLHVKPAGRPSALVRRDGAPRRQGSHELAGSGSLLEEGQDLRSDGLRPLLLGVPEPVHPDESTARGIIHLRTEATWSPDSTRWRSSRRSGGEARGAHAEDIRSGQGTRKPPPRGKRAAFGTSAA
mmetsp:Transcript_78358/g.244070  ORF Transcript_78358/g.244070 Transcript_78358/m.244070 type:complete len:208 (-) Transcript_78358:3-626(-)